MNNNELVKLNRKYGIRDQLIFKEGSGGFIIAEIRNPHGEATVALHGGHIMSFRPRDHEPVLWLSKNSHFKTDKARKMKDFGDGEYKRMVCVETANADTDVISLAPGKTHTLECIIRLE